MTTTTTAATVPAPAEQRAAKPVTVRRKWTEHGLVFIAPFLLTYALFLLWPLVSGIGMSLRSDNITGEGGEFVGFDNYTEAFRDPGVWSSLWNTIWFTVLSTVPLVVTGLVLALL